MLQEVLGKTAIASDSTNSDHGSNSGDVTRSAAKLACHGRCHCGAVHFEVQLDPAAGTRKCNCSFCTRTRFWKVFVNAADVHLHEGSSMLQEYRFGSAMVKHSFCGRCGTHVFMRADCATDEYVINVACLDDAARTLMSNAPLRFEDGRNDDWWSAPAETRHL